MQTSSNKDNRGTAQNRQVYDVQNTSVDAQSEEMSTEDIETNGVSMQGRAGVNPDRKFQFYRNKTEKWGRMIMYFGYFIMIFNAFAFCMTVLNILGFFNMNDSYFESDDATQSRQREKDYAKEVESRKDISNDEKFNLVVQEQMDEQNNRLHKMIMSPQMQNIDNIVKLLEEGF